MHVPKQQKAKLDLKVIECIFLGFGDNKFGYRLWDPENKKLIWNKDVVFKEDQTFGDFEKEEESPQEYVRRSFKERDEPLTSIREEKEARVDQSLLPPSDDGEDMDEFFYGVVNDFVYDDE